MKWKPDANRPHKWRAEHELLTLSVVKIKVPVPRFQIEQTLYRWTIRHGDHILGSESDDSLKLSRKTCELHAERLAQEPVVQALADEAALEAAGWFQVDPMDHQDLDVPALTVRVHGIGGIVSLRCDGDPMKPGSTYLRSLGTGAEHNGRVIRVFATGTSAYCLWGWSA